MPYMRGARKNKIPPKVKYCQADFSSIVSTFCTLKVVWSVMSSTTSQPPEGDSRIPSPLSKERPFNQVDAHHDPTQLTHNPRPYFLETPNERDRRIRNLFQSLDRNRKGYLDSDCILKGFQQMTHLPARTKYARDLLEKCDTSQDGVIDYDEFKIYVEEREKELWSMFEEIDKSGDGRLQPEELEHALQRAGIRVTKDDFWQFMEAMDADGNGVIDFQEWRDFLLVSICRSNHGSKSLHIRLIPGGFFFRIATA